MDIEENYLAVLVAAIASMVLGSLWYGPLFGKQWMALSGVTKEKIEQDKPNMGKLYAIQAVASLIMAYVLFHFIYPATSLSEALEWTGWIWLGFIATVTLGNVLWHGRPKALWVFENAYYLLNLLIMTTILYSWS
ncbi:DUF1761 domain-containing protein [Candidatus Uhrbacteria bacterium]|nr:DUF1761 domain-containing protein [Candidatus Uhrbacteria bacterium]